MLIDADAERVLRDNWREGIRHDGIEYAYTCPSPRRYKHQWYWDSCFHAIAWSRVDLARARAELETLMRAGQPDGFIPHTTFWGRPAVWRRAPFYATERWRGCEATASIQTPLLAFAWEIVAAASASAAASPSAEGPAPTALAGLRAHHDWLAHHRDPDDDGLLTILLPDESGLDDSPKYDPVYGRLSHYRPGYFWLVDRCRRLRWDSRAIIAATDEHVEDVLVNVAYALSGHALARLLGHADGAAYARRADATVAALLERCWDERRGLFFDLAGRRERRVEVSTWSALAPLALGEAVPEEIRRRLVEEHLLDPRRFGAAYGIPSVSMDEPAFNPEWDRFKTWRGPSWVNTAWLLVPALADLGYRDEAERIVGALTTAAGRTGLREYYHPHTGAGLGARDFAWSTLLVDLRARVPPRSAAPA